ncbi:MAG: 50S ribosomal protein L10 [Cyclobacteriaceae bacterium]
MTREEKAEIVKELAQKLQENGSFYITDTSGLTVAEINKFRGMCFDKGVEYKVVKNTLIRKALESLDSDFTALEDVLKGSSGIMFSKEVANAPAKIIKEFKKTDADGRPSLKGASIDTDLFIGEQHLNTLSDLKSREELIGEVIGLLQSPAKTVVSALQSGGQTISGIVKTLSER